MTKPTENWRRVGGEMGERISNLDWGQTPLGSLDSWPDELVNATGILLGAKSPMALAWGPRLVLLYNDAYRDAISVSHPDALGQPLKKGHAADSADERVLSERFREDFSEGLNDRYFDWMTNPIYLHDGSVGGFLMFASDVTPRVHEARAAGKLHDSLRQKVSLQDADRKHAEVELRQAHDLIEQITQGTEDMIAAEDQNFRYLYFNDAYFREFKKLWGQQEIQVGASMLEALAPWPEEQQKAKALWARALRGESFNITMEFGPSEEEKQYYDLRFYPLRDETGKITGAAHIFRNVSAQVELQRSLAESSERFRTLADNISQLAWMAAPSGSVFWYNKRWFDFTGTTPEQMEGLGWKKVHHPDHVDRVARNFMTRIGEGRPWEDTFPLRRADGQYRWFLTRMIPVRDEEGRITRWLGTHTDVTEQLEIEDRLRESDRRKDEFLAMLGHELRNPLSAIGTATEVVKRKAFDDTKLQRVAGILKRQSSHMSALVDGLLEVSRIARGKIELDFKTVELSVVLRGIAEDCEPLYEKAGLKLALDLPAQPVWVSADVVRLTQVFGNLMANARKFTERGGALTVTLRQTDDTAVVVFTDSGLGIRPEMVPLVFEPFRQEKQTMARSEGGLGLGLALAKGLVELHAGTIEARSGGLGKGSEFEVRLPVVAAPQEVAARPELSQTPAGLKVLIIEDQVDLSDTLAEVLESEGHQVEVVHTGESGVERMQEIDRDVILCDVGLPGIDGYEVARRLRRSQHGRDAFLIALTGYGQHSDKEKAKEAGFDVHLVKPVNLDQLTEVLAQAM